MKYSSYTIRSTLAQLNNLIVLQIREIEKNCAIITTPELPTMCQIQQARTINIKQQAHDINIKEYEKLEHYVNRYKTIEEAIRITNYTESPIQK